jgi:medium-chain acyl-[acyl-carrier-protein] hydrolase
MTDLAKEYADKRRVASYEVGAQCLLKLSVLMRMCQEISSRNMELLGLSYERMRADGIVFLLITNRIKIKRMPLHGEEIVIKTHPRGVLGAQFYRDFEFYLGPEKIIEVMQTSVIADSNTHRILRPKQFFEYGIFSDEKVAQEDRIPKLSITESLPFLGERPVRFSDLDYNCHLNNTVYGDIITDYLPGGARGRQYEEVQINYITESALGDVLKIYGEERDGQILMQGVNERGCGFTALAKLRPISEEEIELARTHIL